MEEDDDDFYGGPGQVEQEQDAEDADEKEENMDVSEEGEEDDSDDDVQFTLEKPEGAKSEPPTKQIKTQHNRTTSESRPAKSSTPVKQEAQRAGSTAPPPAAIKGTLTHNGKEGKDFPGVHASKLDLDATPTWPPNGKPITEVDIDADLAENSKPWRLPGTDITDFFNYGFDEYTWASYCFKQQTMSNTIDDLKKSDAQMKALLGGGGNGGGNGGMPPMPPMDQMEQAMQMMQNGTFSEQDFMQMMGGMGGMGGFQGGQGGRFQGGGFGSGQNSASPHPQSGQGFQPPSGPSGGQGQQGGFQGNMEGFSPQQIAIMQQEQGGGGGGRGRGRRGRGGW